jgi:low temperature requirement protein LtrA
MPGQSWLELFYDLAFVAAILVMSSTYSKYAGVEGVIWLGLVFSLIWCTWLTTTLMLGAGLVTTMWTRTLLLVQMVLVLGVAITSNYTHQDHSEAVGPIFAFVLVTLALLYRAARKVNAELAIAYKGYGLRCLLAAAVFAGAPLFGWPWWYPAIWVFGILLFMLPTGSEERHLPMDAHHVVHRFGEFTIIMLGEVFVKLGITATQEPLDSVDMIGLPLATAVVFGIWWLYFTDVPAMGLSSDHGRRLTWVYLHFPLHLSLVASAVALAHILVPHHESGHAEAGTISTIRYIVIPIAVILVAIGLIGMYGGGPRELVRRRFRVFLFASAALVVAEVALLGFNSYDLEASALIVSIVLAVTAWRIRRILVPASVAASAPEA